MVVSVVVEVDVGRLLSTNDILRVYCTEVSKSVVEHIVLELVHQWLGQVLNQVLLTL